MEVKDNKGGIGEASCGVMKGAQKEEEGVRGYELSCVNKMILERENSPWNHVSRVN